MNRGTSLHRCRCGKLIVSDPVACSIKHEAPQCAAFAAAMAAAGMKPDYNPWAYVVDPLTGEVKERGSA